MWVWLSPKTVWTLQTLERLQKFCGFCVSGLGDVLGRWLPPSKAEGWQCLRAPKTSVSWLANLDFTRRPCCYATSKGPGFLNITLAWKDLSYLNHFLIFVSLRHVSGGLLLNWVSSAFSDAQFLFYKISKHRPRETHQIKRHPVHFWRIQHLVGSLFSVGCLTTRTLESLSRKRPKKQQLVSYGPWMFDLKGWSLTYHFVEVPDQLTRKGLS